MNIRGALTSLEIGKKKIKKLSHVMGPENISNPAPKLQNGVIFGIKATPKWCKNYTKWIVWHQIWCQMFIWCNFYTILEFLKIPSIPYCLLTKQICSIYVPLISYYITPKQKTFEKFRGNISSYRRKILFGVLYSASGLEYFYKWCKRYTKIVSCVGDGLIKNADTSCRSTHIGNDTQHLQGTITSRL